MERNGLGRELHDNINQILSVIKMYLGMARTGDGIQEVLIDKSYAYVNEAIGEIRKLSHSLVAPTLGDIGLKEALEELTRDTNYLKNLQVKFDIDESYNENGMDENKKLMFYRIVQEQLNNIIKYAAATKVVLTMRVDSDQLHLSVADNGVGFDTSRKAYGIGFRNINSRIEFYSGHMNVISAPGCGCTLEVTIPY
jgi:two-component system sensor histidine kinase UhpB